MTYINNRIAFKQNHLYVEDLCVDKLNIQTPYYCYSAQSIIDNYQAISKATPNASICYAIKANPNLSIIKLIAEQGAGADIVSMGEMKRALISGAKKILFSGVAKTAEEIEFALKHNVYQINVESLQELELVRRTACQLGLSAPIGIRVNVGVNANTHNKVSTARNEDKFGISIDDAKQLHNTNDIIALSVHIGSQISSTKPFAEAFHKIKDLISYFENIQRVDLGGGFFVPYDIREPNFNYVKYNQIIQDIFGTQFEIIIEPGRSLVANAGLLITKVLYVKRSTHRTHVIVDAGMNDLLRPALYGSEHEVIPLIQSSDQTEIVDIVGPICETSDTFAKQKEIPRVQEGDLLAICTTGAYGSSMSNNYNSRLRASEVMIQGDKHFSIRKQDTYQQLIENELNSELYSFNNEF